LSLDYADFNQSLEKAKKAASSAAASIEKSFDKISLLVEVDDSALYDLNKHLDLKYKHFKEVNRYFKNNPITPTVDGRRLDPLEQRLKELRKLTVQVQSSDGIAQTQVQQQHQQQEIKLDTSDLRKSIGEVESAIEKAGKKNIFGEALLAPLKIAGSAISKVTEGVLLGVGTPLGEEVGTGIKDGIVNESSQIIGSFQLISREIAGGLVQEIIKALGSGAAEIRDVANAIAGKDNVGLESASVRQEIAAKNRRRQSTAGRQISEEYIGLVGNAQGIRDRRDALFAQRNKLQKYAKQVERQIKEYQEKLGIRELEDRVKSTTERLQEITSQMLSDPDDITFTSLQKEADSLQKSLSDTVKRMSEIPQQAEFRFKNETDLINEVHEELLTKEFQFTTELEPLELIDKVKKIKPAKFGKSASKKAQPEAYKLIYDEVLRYSNIDPSQAVMPELKVNPNMPARVRGLYDYKTNQVVVSQDFYDVIKSGKMAIDQFDTITHELRHAVQFDFGRIKADVEAPAIKLISPSSEQLSRFATTIEGSVTHAVTHSGKPENEPRIRAIEADAYAFADNVKDSIALSVEKAFSVSQFQSQFGIGGGKTILAIGVAQRDALLKLKKIK
ncbi:MAG: hypothetical protein ACKOQ2_23380, partial [Dolichospermum sp.]